MKPISSLIKFEVKETKIRSPKDEIVKAFTEAMNPHRIKEGLKPITEKRVAILINSHPILKSDLGECFALLKECKEKGNFKKFWWSMKV